MPADRSRASPVIKPKSIFTVGRSQKFQGQDHKGGGRIIL
jgi:hypothetical protein